LAISRCRARKLSDFADKTLALYRQRTFETAVGEQNNGFRLAMNAEREIATSGRKATSEDAKWFTVLGSAPLRQVFQTALGLPSSFASIDLDQQLGVLKARAKSTFGSEGISQFADPDKLQQLVRTYLTRSEIAVGRHPGQPVLGGAAFQITVAGSRLLALQAGL
jgi:hypothetical protein